MNLKEMKMLFVTVVTMFALAFVLAVACITLGLFMGFVICGAGLAIAGLFPRVENWVAKEEGVLGSVVFFIAPFALGLVGSMWLFHDHVLPRIILLL